MATRMQQRRGTATMWTNANPILGVAEIGYETDTNKFKIGDGTNRWADLSYFVDLDTMIEGAPGLLNSLDEIAAAIGDDPAFFTTLATNLSAKAPLASPTFTGTVSGVTKAHVGLGNVDNTSDANKPVSTATQTALDLKANTSAITELAQDAVAEALVPGSGIATSYNDGANTITVSVDSTVATKTYADEAVSDAVAALTKSSVGLNVVDNTSDADKPISSYAQTALDLKAPLANPTFTGTVSGVTKAHVGLGQVDNSSDAAKPISTATQTALDLKAPIASPTFTGTVSGVTKAHVGLGNVNNTSDADKPVSTAQATAIATAKSEAIDEILGAGVPEALNTLDELAAALGDDANYAATVTTALGTKAPLASPALTGNPTAPTQTVGNDSTRIATTAFVKSAIEDIASLNLVLDGGGV
jgi:hypothetical protein